MFALGRPRLLEDQELKAEVLSRFQSKKVASLEQTGISKIGNVSVRDYATARTFPLVNGGESALRVTQGEGNGFTVESVDQVSGVGRGSATVLTKDGYLLTADHCLGKERPYVFCPTPDGKVEAVEARVVWRRVDKDKEPDFAIIHVPRTLPFAFPMRQRDPVSREKTISAGFGGFTDSVQLCGGTAFKTYAKAGTGHIGKWKRFAHNTPIIPGDSGGPLFDSDGNLIGINANGNLKVLRWMENNYLLPIYRWTAQMPEEGWLTSTIEADRKRQSTKRS